MIRHIQIGAHILIERVKESTITKKRLAHTFGSLSAEQPKPTYYSPVQTGVKGEGR
jgi:hypothetical protein